MAGLYIWVIIIWKWKYDVKSFDVATVLCAFNCSSEWEKGNPPLIEYGVNLNILIISFFVSFLLENKACHSFLYSVWDANVQNSFASFLV